MTTKSHTHTRRGQLSQSDRFSSAQYRPNISCSVRTHKRDWSEKIKKFSMRSTASTQPGDIVMRSTGHFDVRCWTGIFRRKGGKKMLSSTVRTSISRGRLVSDFFLQIKSDRERKKKEKKSSKIKQYILIKYKLVENISRLDIPPICVTDSLAHTQRGIDDQKKKKLKEGINDCHKRSKMLFFPPYTTSSRLAVFFLVVHGPLSCARSLIGRRYLYALKQGEREREETCYHLLSPLFHQISTRKAARIHVCVYICVCIYLYIYIYFQKKRQRQGCVAILMASAPSLVCQRF